jgi:asparagine synthase (glutamine-hydrolysing)
VCGIVGWVGRAPLPADALDPALERLAPRGPDGSGTWRSPGGRALLGHRRLAILDTSPRSAQPFVAPDGASVFIHNGEIYNFRELRARLESAGERFASDGDAEVAQRWLDREGPKGLGGLEGMFSLALWSEREGRLLLARDRLGIKPLYYAQLPGGIAFASQPRALLALPPITARLDPDALSDYLAYGYVPFDRCIFAGIRKLPPAHTLLYEPDGGRLALQAYWRLEPSEIRDSSEELLERLRQAVSSHMVSDVPVGAFLSGGLDSTAIVALASRERSALATFAVGYADGDLSDLRYARQAAQALHTRHSERLLRMDGLAPALARCAEVYDEPVYDPRALAMLDLARMTRESVKVVLSGDGGDEVFGGYGWHETVMRYEARRERWGALEGLFASAWRNFVRPAAEHPLAGRLSGTARLLAPEFARRYFAVRGFFSESEQRRVLGRSPGDATRLFRQFDRPELPITHRLLWLDLHTYLPDNGLVLVDRSTMAVGLEARVPLLDHRLVEYAFSLPPHRLLRPGATKVAFREAAEALVPEAIRTRPKSGFSPPFKGWLRGPGRDPAFAMLERGLLSRDGVIEASAVRSLVEGGAQRRYNKLWLLLNLEAWYGRWIAGTAGKNAGLEESTAIRQERDEELLEGEVAARPAVF